MALIPVFKKCGREYLMETWGMEFPLSAWVQAEIGGKSYESNRYDIVYKDTAENRTISVFLYMNEDSDEIYAIDEVVTDVEKGCTYDLKETPFAKILTDIKDKKVTDKEKLLTVLKEIGADVFESSDEDVDRIIVQNEEYDVEERRFEFKFNKDTGLYFE